MRSSHFKVVVVGSLNVDYIASVDRLPAAGETVTASGLMRRFGGKGANQAVAVHRMVRKLVRVDVLGHQRAKACGQANENKNFAR